jgi:cytochrome c biogenesis protein CcmG, thiol:disulfide interchange protein DsbE
MPRRFRFLESQPIRLTVAAVCIVAAVVIVWSAGLPDRATTDAVSFSTVNGVEQPVAPEIGALAPPFAATTITGKSLSLAALHGSPVLLNFWATWCGPCVAEMPLIQRAQDAYQGKGLRVVLINSNERVEDVEVWNAQLGLTADTIIDDGSLDKIYRLRGLPTTIFIGRDGIIRNIVYGPLNEQLLDTTITMILK